MEYEGRVEFNLQKLSELHAILQLMLNQHLVAATYYSSET